jgi:thiol:disulfide interchange protein DsbD
MSTPYIYVTRLLLAVLLIAGTAVQAAPDIKRAHEVFLYTAAVEGANVVVEWDVADGYYLYRDKMSFSAGGAELGAPVFPAGEVHADEFFGEQIVFRGNSVVIIPLLSTPPGAITLELLIRSQGCADFGLCYPPQKWTTTLNVATSQLATRGFPFGGGTPVSGQPLQPEQAFIPSVSTLNPFTIEVRWEIAPGYYLYKKDFGVTNPGQDVQLGALQLQPGVMVLDIEYGETEVYYDQAVFRMPLSRATPDPQSIELALAYQGCKEGSICYPPATVMLPLELPRATSSDVPPPPVSEQDRLFGVVSSASLPTVMMVFLGLGLLLAFTPCCLPMVPILSGIIAGQGDNVTTARSFWLSLSYVLGMAFTYTLAGALVGAMGGQIQAALQTPAIIGFVALLFVALSLGMFGVYELQLPATLQTRLTALGSSGKAGSFIGTAVMGAISALVVSTCVAPPLVAALAVIAQTGDVARGAFALFALSIGMGIPLIIFGVSAGKLLPKAGAWMNTVKAVFGFMLLGLAIWMLDRILPGTLTMALYAALAVFAGTWFGAFTKMPRPASGGALSGKAIAVMLVLYGAALSIGAMSGSVNPLQPLNRISGATAQHELPFQMIKSLDDFEAARLTAAANNQPLMLDFYADWCVSCKEMEFWTFTDANVQSALANTVLIQADVTANDDVDQALLEHFGIFGPPTIVFYNRAGNEITGQRVIGYMGTDNFLTHLEYVLR